MINRKKLGLVFSYDEQWIGGTYYTINLVHALNKLSDNQKPEIIVFSNTKDFQRLVGETDYPYLVFEDISQSEYSRLEKVINNVSGRILKKKILRKSYKKPIDALFILQRSEYLESIPAEKRIYWIPDFQDKHYPQFFTEDGLRKKDERSKWVHQNAKKIIFSSQAVTDDWNKFYPNYKGVVKVVHFAVTHPEFDSLSIEELRLKHSIPEEYFFAPNQFWAHKNHMLVIKAAEILKNQGQPMVIAFSGKENDNRNPGYTESLKEYVAENNLEDVVKFLGFLDRREQLKLMKHAVAVIQPSLFEGWSTVIEDAMAMNQRVIASDLDVNKEQLLEKGIYFDRESPIALAESLKSFKGSEVDYLYNNKKVKFGEMLLESFGI